MKTTMLLLILGMSITFSSHSQIPQKDIVPIVISKKIYLGLDNIITEISPDMKHKLIFSSNSGHFFIEGNNVHFSPTRNGYANLNVSTLNKDGDTVLVGEYSIFINKVPEPQVSIGRFPSGDTLSIEDIIYQPGLGIAVKFPIEARYKVTSYSFICLRGDSIIYREHVNDPYLSDKMKGFIKTTKRGDLLIFKDIRAINKTSDTEFSPPLLYYFVK
ncbi:MAG TPA: GldM family protein [Edaphocola sp.]|nr:GldM family protein [Edaphocola sp.]